MRLSPDPRTHGDLGVLRWCGAKRIGIRVRDQLTPPNPANRIVARTGGYTFAAKVWSLFVAQGPFLCRPVPNPSSIFSPSMPLGLSILYPSIHPYRPFAAPRLVLTPTARSRGAAAAAIRDLMADYFSETPPPPPHEPIPWLVATDAAGLVTLDTVRKPLLNFTDPFQTPVEFEGPSSNPC